MIRIPFQLIIITILLHSLFSPLSMHHHDELARFHLNAFFT